MLYSVDLEGEVWVSFKHLDSNFFLWKLENVFAPPLPYTQETVLYITFYDVIPILYYRRDFLKTRDNNSNNNNATMQ